ncbi:hypothetical protein V1478_006676 [Vespula squamosa]|uniref:Uncharacterized protein n=1 Tax=Vespula squamosa TaxID=30214 RepID=A0ABD2B8K3_VESSQ
MGARYGGEGGTSSAVGKRSSPGGDNGSPMVGWRRVRARYEAELGTKMNAFVSRIRRSLASKVAQNLMKSNERGRKTREKIELTQPSGYIAKERFSTYKIYLVRKILR